MIARLRRQDGHTLPELLTAVTMATVIMLATFALLDHVLRRTGETQARVEATQKGRMAMDTMIRALRSQVCLSATVPAMAAASSTSVTFYSDFGDAGVPDMHVIRYDAGTGKLIDDVYPGSGALPATTFPAAPAQRRQLAEYVEPDGSTPIFRFFAYNTATPPRAELALGNPVAAADIPRIARVAIAYRARAGRGSGSDRAGVVFHDDVYFRAADPNDPAPYPTCA